MTPDVPVLSGAIPGLLRRGSPVDGKYLEGRGVVFRVDADGFSVQDASANELDGSWGGWAGGVLSLDIGDPTGRYHAALWLHDRGHASWWALDGPGPLTAEESAAALAVSVLRVAAGGKPIAGVRGRWRTGHSTQRRGLVAGEDHLDFEVTGCEWFKHDAATPEGTEASNEAARAAADRAWLAAGYALLNPDGTLTLPPVETTRG